LTRITEEQLLEFEDIGVKVASSIVQFFHDPIQLHMIESLIQLGLNVEQTTHQAKDGSLTGLNFLFTGSLKQLKRSDAEAMVEAKGGHILSGVSSKLNYLIVGEDAGSKLEKAKKIASIKIMTEAEFIELINSDSKS
jgi:DNA ligase (NAD+)